MPSGWPAKVNNAIEGPIAIIGGSGLDRFGELEDIEPVEVETPWGRPAEAPQKAQFAGAALFFLPRHGADHRLPPHRINYRANIAALHQLGVKTIIACNVVGGINREMRPGDLVIPDQLIDYTWGRGHTFFDGMGDTSEGVRHIDFTHPFSPLVNRALLKAAESLQVKVHHPATFGVTQGPRLETAAEIRRMGRDGCDIVGMTSMPEATLAAERGIAYSSIALVVNPAAGVSDQPITEEGMAGVMVQGIAGIKALLSAFLRAISR